MSGWVANVFETVTREVEYTVEADNIEEAREMLTAGDTVKERDLTIGEVIGREIATGRDPDGDIRPVFDGKG